ncbi:MAG: hypothetical protein WCT08_03485 [Patescibacteria group bacterium]|jgi:hypothetical protein
MDPQFDINTTTFYFIIPLIVIGLVGLIWFFVKMKTTPWRRITLAVISLFAFFGFVTGVLAVYYQVNDAFAGMFKFYAYSKLAPESDPFTQPDDPNGIISVLGMTEVHKENGEVKLAELPSSVNFDYAGYIFSPGKWQWVELVDRTLQIRDLDENGEPDIINTSLWWALTNDPYKLSGSANMIEE